MDGSLNNEEEQKSGEAEAAVGDVAAGDVAPSVATVSDALQGLKLAQQAAAGPLAASRAHGLQEHAGA